MKYLIFLLLVSMNTFAGDLIYKNSFENEVLVSGTSSGLQYTGLQLTLTADGGVYETLTVNEDGAFVFSSYVEVGSNWSVTIQSLPNTPTQQSCSTANDSGTAPSGGVNNLQVSCNNTPWNWDEMNWDEGGWN